MVPIDDLFGAKAAIPRVLALLGKFRVAVQVFSIIKNKCMLECFLQ